MGGQTSWLPRRSVAACTGIGAAHALAQVASVARASLVGVFKKIFLFS